MNKLITCLLQSARNSSPCNRKKVGAVIENLDGTLTIGYNNNRLNSSCEDDKGETLPDTIHAELDAIITNRDSRDTTMYITNIPCRHCAECIVRAGITTVYIPKKDKRRGLDILLSSGINIVEYDNSLIGD